MGGVCEFCCGNYDVVWYLNLFGVDFNIIKVV